MTRRRQGSFRGRVPGPFFRVALWRLVRVARNYSNYPYLVFGNSAYKEIVLNWLEASARIGVSDVIVVAYDRALYRQLRDEGVVTVFVPMAPGKENLWWRLFVFRAVCRAGIDFVHCDADAVLLRNPSSVLEGFSNVDLIISQGTVHPPAIAESRGFVVCMGFFFLRGTKGSLEIVSIAISKISDTKTDQAALNFALPPEAASWDYLQGEVTRHKHLGTEFLISDAPITLTRAESASVVVLAGTEFQRLYMGAKHAPFLIHPLANQKAETKVETLKKHGLWFLPS